MATEPSPVGSGSNPIGVGVGVANFRPIATIAGAGDCVRISSSTRIVLEGFELDQCGGHGVLIEDSTNVGIVGNKILGAGADGVRDDASDGSYLNGNIVGQSDGLGVALSNSTNARVVDNLVGLNGTAQTSGGISVVSVFPVGETIAGGGAFSNSIVNNTIVENPGGCIFDAASDTKIESNTCSGSSDPPRTITVDASASGGEIVANIGIIDDPFMNSDEEDNCPVSAPC